VTQLGAWALVLFGAAYGCALDDRVLSTGSEGNLVSPGGESSGSAPNTDAGKPPQVQGGAETGGAGSCPDLDTDGTPDCEATLLKDGGFDRNFAAWQAGEGTNLAWVSDDALENSKSGSLELTSMGPAASASQCLAFSADPLLITWGQAFIDPGAEAQTQAWIEVELFKQANCQGDSSGFFDTPTSSVTGAWNVVQAGGIAGADTRSVKVTVNALGPHALAKTPIRFDNVMLTAKPVN
jgi:hypothetical protein